MYFVAVEKGNKCAGVAENCIPGYTGWCWDSFYCVEGLCVNSEVLETYDSVLSSPICLFIEKIDVFWLLARNQYHFVDDESRNWE